jgi:cell division protein FtsB
MNNKLVVRIIIFILFLGISAFIIFNDNGLIKFLKLREEIGKLNQEIEKTKKKLSQLENEIDSLQSNKEKLERVAREKFHMMKSNEKTFRLEEK